MRFKMARGFSIAAIGFSLAGCGVTSGSLSDTFGFGTKPTAPANEATEANASVPLTPGVVVPTGPGLLGSEPYDDLTLGKRYLAAGNYGLAERYFRHAVETHARDAEAWLGLAAAYDRLRRFDLADRAYDQAIKIAGPTPELLNNRGYSFMLRGDYRRAQQTLLQAQALDPSNPYVRNNLELLEASFRKGKAIQ